MSNQAGTVYRYFRADASKDISADVFQISVDGGVTWVSGTYVADGSLPPDVAAVNVATPPATGRDGYWFRVLTGPNGLVQLCRGPNHVLGQATDNPESPHFGWTVNVGKDE